MLEFQERYEAAVEAVTQASKKATETAHRTADAQKYAAEALGASQKDQQQILSNMIHDGLITQMDLCLLYTSRCV